jgi:septal ring factor EnvC (AmiA/AmiB activator)
MTDIDTENARLVAEIKVLETKINTISKKLESSNCKKAQLKKELKKKDARTIVLTKEQEQSLSSLLNDINILSLLSD